MATATAPAIRREIVETLDLGDGQLVHRYRYGDGPDDIDSAMETITPIDPAILADRWDGLMDDGSEAYDHLNEALADLADGVTRRSVGRPDTVVVDGKIVGADLVMDLDGLMTVIRDWILARAVGIAR